jgi:hypothetical protein
MSSDDIRNSKNRINSIQLFALILAVFSIVMYAFPLLGQISNYRNTYVVQVGNVIFSELDFRNYKALNKFLLGQKEYSKRDFLYDKLLAFEAKAANIVPMDLEVKQFIKRYPNLTERLILDPFKRNRERYFATFQDFIVERVRIDKLKKIYGLTNNIFLPDADSAKVQLIERQVKMSNPAVDSLELESFYRQNLDKYKKSFITVEFIDIPLAPKKLEQNDLVSYYLSNPDRFYDAELRSGYVIEFDDSSTELEFCDTIDKTKKLPDRFTPFITQRMLNETLNINDVFSKALFNIEKNKPYRKIKDKQYVILSEIVASKRKAISEVLDELQSELLEKQRKETYNKLQQLKIAEKFKTYGNLISNIELEVGREYDDPYKEIVLHLIKLNKDNYEFVVTGNFLRICRKTGKYDYLPDFQEVKNLVYKHVLDLKLQQQRENVINQFMSVSFPHDIQTITVTYKNCNPVLRDFIFSTPVNTRKICFCNNNLFDFKVRKFETSEIRSQTLQDIIGPLVYLELYKKFNIKVFNLIDDYA